MNPVTRALGILVRSLRLRGEEGWVAHRPVIALVALLMGLVGFGVAADKAKDDEAIDTSAAATTATASRSTTIALTSDEQRVVVVNREANSISIIRVRAKGEDVGNKLAEIGVGEEPRCVAVSPDDRFAYVTNGISGTVSVVNLNRFRVEKTIEKVGTEPRGCALTPNGRLLYVANHTEGTVSIINTGSRTVVGKVNVGGNPTAIAITNDGDAAGVADERVFVTQIFAELDPDFVDPVFNGNGEVRDLGKRGVVHTFQVQAGNANPTITKITLAPIADSGFIANRTAFCTKAAPPPTPLSHLLPEPGRSYRPRNRE